MILSDFLKKRCHRGLPPNVYFWRDKLGNEIDCLLEEGAGLFPIEIKSSATIRSEMFDGLVKWCNWAEINSEIGAVVYAGDEKQTRKQGSIISWRFL
jgi:predicted AAA+ superfamily ATPase